MPQEKNKQADENNNAEAGTNIENSKLNTHPGSNGISHANAHQTENKNTHVNEQSGRTHSYVVFFLLLVLIALVLAYLWYKKKNNSKKKPGKK